VEFTQIKISQSLLNSNQSLSSKANNKNSSKYTTIEKCSKTNLNYHPFLFLTNLKKKNKINKKKKKNQLFTGIINS
jgi:hypothetical protein